VPTSLACPSRHDACNFVGAKPVPMPLKEENDFRIDNEEILSKINKKTKMIILNSPENPTGGVLSKDNLEAIADGVRGRDDFVRNGVWKLWRRLLAVIVCQLCGKHNEGFAENFRGSRRTLT
jgi:hypothetical protein